MASQIQSSKDRVRYERGQVLRRRKGLVMHTGVSLGDGRVLHNTPERGEHLSTLEEFHKGKPMRVSPATDETRSRLESLADEDLGGAYNLFTNNCEHTANRVLTGVSSSPQLRGAAVQILAGVVLLAVFRKPLVAAGLRVGSRVLRKFVA